MPFGITGFDETAYFYWRRHEGQLNKALSKLGITHTNDSLKMIQDHDLINRWNFYGKDIAIFVVKKYKRKKIFSK